MGLYDPTKDATNNTNDDLEDIKINSIDVFDQPTLPLFGLHDSLQRTLSKTNDMTLSAVDRLRGWSDGLGALLSTIDGQVDSFTGLLGGKVLKKPNEIVSKGIPPSEIYQECKSIDGLAVWDQYGWWHCLFPRNKIQNKAFGEDLNNLLSKEDIENDVDNKYGLFFKNLDDLLGWQTNMKKIMADQKRKKWLDWEQREKAKWSFLNDNGYDTDDNADDKGKVIVGRESQTSMTSLPNGDYERTIYQRRVYDDGTSRVWEKKEILGPDGSIKEEKKD